MKRTTLKLLALSILTIAGMQQAYAADLGTDADTSVTNTVVITWKVGGITQTAPTPTEQPAMEVTFKVDRKVNLTMTADAQTAISPGQTGVMLTYLVTNKTNDTADFVLAYEKDESAFALSNVHMYVDDGDNTFEDGTDNVVGNEITYIDDLAEDTGRNVYIFADMAADAADTEVASITLKAQAVAKTGSEGAPGAALAETAGADNAAAVDNVFADGDGPHSLDADQDGEYSATGTYTISGTNINVSKTYTVLSDGFSAAGQEKPIPGAIVLYCITVENAGAANADHIGVSDVVPGSTTYQTDGDNGIKVFVEQASAPACDAATFTSGTSLDDDSVDESGDDNPAGATAYGSFSANTISTTVPTLTSSKFTTTMFKVKID
jgi:uncharacterized repeat protein (TIGR01451 family)